MRSSTPACPAAHSLPPARVARGGPQWFRGTPSTHMGRASSAGRARASDGLTSSVCASHDGLHGTVYLGVSATIAPRRCCRTSSRRCACSAATPTRPSASPVIRFRCRCRAAPLRAEPQRLFACAHVCTYALECVFVCLHPSLSCGRCGGGRASQSGSQSAGSESSTGVLGVLTRGYSESSHKGTRGTRKRVLGVLTKGYSGYSEHGAAEQPAG